MSYAIVGSGSVGTALATQFARHGIEVAITNTRGPESLAALAKSLGPAVHPVTLEQALEASLVSALGFAPKVKATNRPFEDHFVFAVTVRNGKVANIRE